METRAAYLTPDRLESPERIERTVAELHDRGYNTVIVPVLYEGSLTFRTRGTGALRDSNCPGCHALEALSDSPFTVWLAVDILTAGSAETGALGSLAARNRQWLMRNIQGTYAPPSDPDLPGLFCPTSIDYRRFMGNLLVDIVDQFPMDGVVLDIRNLPVATEKPESWMHLGYSCLQRIQRELGYDLEEYLTQPTMEKFRVIDNWRQTQLLTFLENLKSRVQKTRRDLQFFLEVGFEDPEKPYAPWARGAKEGLVDALFLHAPPDAMAAHLEALDQAVGEEMPFLCSLDEENDLGELGKHLATLPTNGYCVRRPDVLHRTVLPEQSLVWSTPGSLESHPVWAALEIVRQLARELKALERAGPFFRKLEEYLTNAGETMKYDIALNIRQDILAILYKVRDGELEVTGNREHTMRMIDQVARLLLLTPIPPVEY